MIRPALAPAVLAIVLAFAMGTYMSVGVSRVLAAEHAAPKAKSGDKTEKKAGEKKKSPPAPPAESDGKIGYSDDEIQLGGMMVPIKTREGTNYQVLTIRLQVAPGETARPACWMGPIVHEKMLMYLHDANLAADDFTGQKRELLAKALLDVAIKATDKGFYSGVVLVDESTPPLAQKSITLSSQCK